ncbi:MAG: type III secretion system gatekeeper subunit SctW [Ramlibacter sp.]
MTRIDAHFANLPPGPTLGGQAGAQTGSLRGEQVVVKSEQSALADAAEEISLFHSEKAETKKHSERKVETDPRGQRMLIAQINEYLDQSKAIPDPAKLKNIARQMLQADGQSPRELARQQSRDPATHYVLIQYALHEGEAGGASAEVLERLQDTLDDLEVDHGPHIRAGLNTIGTAAKWGASASEIAAFQQTYRDVVLGESALAQTLTLVVERLDGSTGDKFESGLKALIVALGADLSAARPSTEPSRLQALVQDLYSLEVFATVLEGCQELRQLLAAG